MADILTVGDIPLILRASLKKIRTMFDAPMPRSTNPNSITGITELVTTKPNLIQQSDFHHLHNQLLTNTLNNLKNDFFRTDIFPYRLSNKDHKDSPCNLFNCDD